MSVVVPNKNPPALANVIKKISQLPLMLPKMPAMMSCMYDDSQLEKFHREQPIVHSCPTKTETLNIYVQSLTLGVYTIV